jgi:hypothetical protein
VEDRGEFSVYLTMIYQLLISNYLYDNYEILIMNKVNENCLSYLRFYAKASLEICKTSESMS